MPGGRSRVFYGGDIGAGPSSARSHAQHGQPGERGTKMSTIELSTQDLPRGGPRQSVILNALVTRSESCGHPRACPSPARPDHDTRDAEHCDHDSHQRNQNAPRQTQDAARVQRKLRLHEEVARATGARHVVPGQHTGSAIEVQPRCLASACASAMTCSRERVGSIGVSMGVGVRVSNGVGTTGENSDTTGFITSRPRFIDTEVIASINNSSHTQTPPER